MDYVFQSAEVSIDKTVKVETYILHLSGKYISSQTELSAEFLSNNKTQTIQALGA